MPDWWTDERDRRTREGDWRRSRGRDDRYDEDLYERPRWAEERSFGARREDSDRDRVFGERETGADYSGRRGPAPGDGPGYRDEPRRPAWQDRDYRGVSPAMRQGEYEAGYGRPRPRFRPQDYTRGPPSGERWRRDEPAPRRAAPNWRDEAVQSLDPEMYWPDYGAYPAMSYELGYRPGGRHVTEGGRDEEPGMMRGDLSGYDYDRGYGDGGREPLRADRWQRLRRDDERDGDESRGGFLHRAGERLTSWFGGAFGEVRRDLGFDEPRRVSADFGREPRWEVDRGHRGRGPKGYRRADDRICDDVHHRLTDDPWLDASQVDVEVSGGEVTLSGFVENREGKHRAERVVEDISGVTHVQNNLRVGGDFLHSAGRGYGDSALEAQMRRDQSDVSTTGEDLAMSRSPTRRS